LRRPNAGSDCDVGDLNRDDYDDCDFNCDADDAV
jgi:hypothetical protein